MAQTWRVVLDWSKSFLWGSQRPTEPSLKKAEIASSSPGVRHCRSLLTWSWAQKLPPDAAQQWGQPAKPFGLLSTIEGRNKTNHTLAQQFAQPLQVSHVKKLCLVQLGFKFIARTLRHHNNTIKTPPDVCHIIHVKKRKDILCADTTTICCSN